MKPHAARKSDGRGSWRWGMLLCGAFLAGLLGVGVLLLLPGQGDKQQSSPSSFAPPAPPAPAPPAPAAVPAQPLLAIVVDDLGYEPGRDAEWLRFPEKITVSVLPFGPSSRSIAESARSRGWEVILHVPMEPDNPAPDRTERFRLHRGMADDEMESLLVRMIESVPGAAGASNHMGSAFTADPEAMAAYAAVLRKKGLFLVDSVTTPRSVALDAAQRAGVPAARRDVILDVDMRPEEIRGQWERALSIARASGRAIVICHARAETLRVLLDLLPGLRREKMRVATVGELIAGKGAAP